MLFPPVPSPFGKINTRAVVPDLDKTVKRSVLTHLGEVSSLTHELRNDAMKFAAFVAESLLMATQLAKVLSSHGHHVGSQLHDNSTRVLFADSDIEEHSRVRLELFGGQICVRIIGFSSCLGAVAGCFLDRSIRRLAAFFVARFCAIVKSSARVLLEPCVIRPN